LHSKIDRQGEDFVGKLGAKKEILIRQKKTIDIPALTEGIFLEMVYI
jgi:hypothetical protein